MYVRHPQALIDLPSAARVSRTTTKNPRVMLGPVGALAVGLVACAEPPARPRPVEIPISDYRVDDGESSRGRATGTREPTTPSGGADRDAGGGSGATSVATVAEEPRVVVTGDNPQPSRELDVKGGFLGAMFGASPKVFRGLVLLGTKGDATTYRVSDKSYGGFALRDVLYVFRKNKLATIQFAVKNATDCRAFKETLVKELGAPQRTAGETITWRGERSGLRFAVASNGQCTGAVQSKELARAEWDAL